MSGTMKQLEEGEMKIRFVKRNEEGLHYRFCQTTMSDFLYETSPVKGIVCGSCKEHLKSYLKEDKEGKK